jgi:hypothetical protein
VVRFFPFELFSIWGGNTNCWHDRWTKTRVVDFDPSRD